MRLSNIIRKIILEDWDSQVQQLKDKYVGEGKPLKEEDFEKIKDIASGKFYIIAWLTKKVGTGIIKNEDIYKWKEYFDIFEKNKNKFEQKDINLYKTAEEVKNFIKKVIEIREGSIQFEDIVGSDNFVSPNDIERLKQTGTDYLGIWKPPATTKEFNKDGYQVFDVKDISKENWKVYRDVLGRCKGRGRGAKIEICTIADYEYFHDYLKDYKGSRYFLLYNLNDPKSPYQLHYESSQFMNKNDDEEYNFPKISFFSWLGEKFPQYSMEKLKKFDFELPKKDSGYEDEKGKQGVWIKYVDGKKDEANTYKNNKLNGLSVYYSGGKIFQKTFFKNGEEHGSHSKFYNNDTVAEEGQHFNGSRVGIWKFAYRQFGAAYILVDEDQMFSYTSGFTKNDKLKFISQKNNHSNVRGKIVFFYPSGSIQADGTLTDNETKTGKWTYYYPDGSIKAEGKYSRGEKDGIWNYFVKDKGSEKILEVNWFRGRAGYEDIKLYNKKGEFIKNLSYWSDEVPRLGDLEVLS